MTNLRPSSSALSQRIAACLIFLACATGAARAQAVDPPALDRKVASRLIADFYEIGQNEITIAFVLDGKTGKAGFEAKFAAEVTFVQTVVAGGRRTREVRSIVFHHDAALGWFLKAVASDKGREYIDICSEHQGRLRIE